MSRDTPKHGDQNTKNLWVGAWGGSFFSFLSSHSLYIQERQGPKRKRKKKWENLKKHLCLSWFGRTQILIPRGPKGL